MPKYAKIPDADVHNNPGVKIIPDADVHNHPTEEQKHSLYHNEHTGRRVVVNGHKGTQIGMHPGSHKPYIKWDN